jgi:hypothetical protein
MPFTTYYGPNTTVSQKCIWIVDGSRRVCISYDYNTSTGILRYAASVFRCDRIDNEDGRHAYFEPTVEEMAAHTHTTSRRYEIRPVIIQVDTQLIYDNLISTIRHEMCRGYGCKGPRRLASTFSNVDIEASDYGSDGSSSDNSFLTDDDNTNLDEKSVQINWDKLIRKTTRNMRYIGISKVENYFGQHIPVTREFFITFKADKKNGHLIYGAAVSRRPTHDFEKYPMTDELVEGHYKTAMARLDKAPMYLKVSEEFRHQLKKNVTHREDVMYDIINRINKRGGGRLAVRFFN